MTAEAGGQIAASAQLTQIVTDGGSHTKGSWVELIASTSNDNEWIGVEFRNLTADETCLVDIGVGAASSEAVVIGNIMVWSNNQVADYVYLPRTIASGSRISARCQSSNGDVRAAVVLHTGDEYGTSSSNITIGDDTSASKGTAVDAGSTANTKGSWTEIEASTSADMDWLVVKFGPNDNAATAAARFLVDIATGAASSETILIPDIFYRQDTTEHFQCRTFHFQETIPSGTRVAVRSQCDITDATDRVIDVSIVGCDMTAP